MGCGSSSLKGTEDAGGTQPAVPKTTTAAAAEGNPMKKVKTNFSNIDYDAPAEGQKSSLLKARAPDELDEGPSRNASYAGPAAAAVGGMGTGAGAGMVAGTGNLQGETKNALTEEKPAENPMLEEREPKHPVPNTITHSSTNPDLDEVSPNPTSHPPNNSPQLNTPSSRRSSLVGLLTGQEGRRQKSNFTDADLKKYAGIDREELKVRARVVPDPTPVPRYANA